jgi:hypothetical protein
MTDDSQQSARHAYGERVIAVAEKLAGRDKNRTTTLPTLGVKITAADGQVSAWPWGRLPGPLAGAQAQITDPGKVRRFGGPASMAISGLGPLALLGMFSRKSKAVALIVFEDGTVHQTNLSGNTEVRNAQVQVVRFNALAGTRS